MNNREWVGIALFLAALTIAASFMFGSASPSNGAEPTISLGIEPPSPTPAASPTESQPATSIEPRGEEWLVAFFSVNVNGDQVDLGTRSSEGLDFSFEGAPIDNAVDNAWGLRAETVLNLDEGRYRIELQVQAEVEISLYGSPVAARGWEAEPGVFQIDFDHPGGELPVLIEAVDVEGPFLLAWQ